MLKTTIAVVSLVVGSPVIARAPAYAHKAGVTPDQHSTDNVGCWNDGMKAMNDPTYVSPWTPNPVTEGSAAGAAGGALARGMAEGLMGGKRFKLTYFDCLHAKGYTLRRPDDAAWKAHKKLKKPERDAEMIAWATAPEPLHPEALRDDFD